MKKEFVVALDIGTSGCRAAAFRKDGSVAASHDMPLTPYRPAPGASQYEGETLLRSAKTTLNTVLDKIGPQRVAALAVTSQRSSIVLWDKISAETAGPILTWEDGRAQTQAQQAPLSQQEVHALTGLYKTPFFSAPKIAWSLKNLPQAATLLAQKRLYAGPIASYLIFHLTEGKTFATDYSLAQRMLLLDIQHLSWSDTLCKAFDVPIDILPDLRPSAADYGTYTYQGTSIPITACLGDQQAAAAYFNLSERESLINYGTGAFWLYHAGEKPVSLPGLLTSVSATRSSQEVCYWLEGPVNAAGSALLWLKAQGINFEENEIDTLCRASQNPLLFLPALGGLGAPYWDFSLTPSVNGLSVRTRKADWVAGTVRAIAFLLTDIATYLHKNGYESEGPVRVSGGLSHINYLTAFQAGLLQRPLEVSEQADATLLGASLVAAEPAQVSCNFAPTYTTITPSCTAEQAQTLYKTWQLFIAHVRS